MDDEKKRKPGRLAFFQDKGEGDPPDSTEEQRRPRDTAEYDSKTDPRLIDLLEAIRAVKAGDFSVRLNARKDGIVGDIAQAFNELVDLKGRVISEATRATRAVGEDGRLTDAASRATVPDATGAWKDFINTLNYLLDCIAMPVTEIGRVVTTIAKGDLSQKMPDSWKNEIAIARGDVSQRMEIRAAGDIRVMVNTINELLDNLNTFSGEVTRVAREVGTEGKLGGQAKVSGMAGTWKDLTDNVNSMASNLTSQVRNIAQVTTAVANGDLNKKITVDAMGEILGIKDTINRMVDQLNSFASEVTRVAKEVGTEGKLGAQADVKGVGGTWKDLTDNVNAMAANLTGQVRNIADVTTAVANGDLNKKITVEAKGEILQLKDTINRMVDQLNSFAAEVTRVAREVGTDGKLGAQADVKGVAGTWKDLTDNVNAMAANLTGQVRNIADVTTAVANGDLNKKITVEAKGEILQLKETINRMVDQLNGFAAEVTRVAREVGTEGKLGGQADVKGVAGTWKDLTDNVNAMAANLTNQVRNIANVTTAVANGDLTRKITVEARGEILELKDTLNRMVDQLNSFAAEVTRVAREVGAEGKLGGQAKVAGVAGTWKDLTENVNLMASTLTSQVRDIAHVTTAVAFGDLTKKITVEAMGEILELKSTLNRMVDQLNTFASEVTRVAKEVGTEGKLGGQADVKGVAGTWKDLTDNVNAMAANLTGQVRNIAEVTMAVANGDLNRKITVEAKGEILQLKDTINRMVDQLNNIIGDVNSVMAVVAEGTLTRLIEAKAFGEFAAMVNGINSTIESLRGIVSELREAGINVGSVSQNLLSAGQEMNSMVTQLSTSVEQIAEGARMQAEQISGASRESEGVGAIASKTLSSAEKMNEMAETAKKATNEGSSAMMDTLKNTDLLLIGSKESVVSIESLSKSNEQIQEIVEVIRDIAAQTNILAINAAIEAVRAGKQGKGFAVVAEEVKTLSADSRTRTKEISMLVGSVQKETAETVTTIKTMAENVGLGQRSIERSSKSLEEIRGSVEITSDTAKSISETAASQKRSIDMVSQSLDKISGIATDTSTASAQLAESARHLLMRMQELMTTATILSDMSEKLQQTVGRFEVLEQSSPRQAAAAVETKRLARPAPRPPARKPLKAK